MGPPINTWPYSHPKFHTSEEKKCLLHTLIDSVRSVSINCTVVVVLVQLLYSLTYVTAGPVILSLDYLQAPVPVARNIRHLPCVSRRTGDEGLCMFAIDCLKANGSHLGTCIDRFYFGSCCQIPDKTILPNIINNIEDNTIDGSNFIHPQEDKIINNLYKNPASTTNKASSLYTTEVTVEKAQDRTEPNDKNKLDKITTIDSTIEDKTTPISSTESLKVTQNTEPSERPVKITTFQSVSIDASKLTTSRPVNIETTQTITTEKPKPSRKPIRPTYKPRPTFRPTNFTRPPYTGTGKPRPTKPLTTIITTRKPPFRIPSKRPPTKKPIQIPPRLNITILPQYTSARPAFTRPPAPSIIYINHTVSKHEETTTPAELSSTLSTTHSTTSTKPSTTTTTTEPSTTVISSTKPSTTTTSTTTTTTTSTTTTAPAPTTTEIELNEKQTETISDTITIETESILQTEALTITEPSKIELTTEISKETEIDTTVRNSEPITIAETTEYKDTTTQELPETETVRSTEAEITTTDFPPFVTWSSNVDTATKTPQKPTTVAEDNWSPITPPEGWVLLTTSKAETSSATVTTTSTTTEATTAEQFPTVITTESTRAPSISSVQTTQTSTTPSTTTTTAVPSTSEQQIQEFTVNVTLSPIVPTTTESIKDNLTSSEKPIDAGQLDKNRTETTTVTTTTTESYNMSNFKEVCGRRMWPQARIVGGSKSSFGEWPWQISLRQYRTSTYLHKCGAALLNENWAITAAHCVEHVPPSELLVRLGEHDLATEDEPYGFAERRVQIIASHPHFDPATFEYDLALLRFYEPVTFQPNILPVCVPDNDDDYVGKTAYVTGWGRLYDEGPLPSVLQEVQVPIINNTACEAMYQAAGYNEHIPNIFICAGWKNGGSDSCEGDSGGPMVIQRDRDNRYVLGGIISWGIGCAEPNQPGVYTRISEFRDWINQILQF